MGLAPTNAQGNGQPVPADLSNLQAIYSNLLQTLAAETAYQVAHGAKPSYSLDGESVSWTEYRAGIIEKLETLKAMIQLEAGPFQLPMQMSF